MLEKDKEVKMVPLFSKNLRLQGKHAKYMKALVNKFDTSLQQGIFQRNLDVYLIAPIVGKLYNRKASAEASSEDTTVHTEQINIEIENLYFIYRLVVFLEDRNNTDMEERCNRAFRYDKNMDKRAFGDKVFEEYLLGGIEVLYEKLLDGNVENSIILENMYCFIDGFFELYSESYDYDDMLQMCQLAGI